MGLNINYIGGSRHTHLKKRTAKHEQEERLERARLAQHKREEAVKRAARSSVNARCNDSTTTTAVAAAGLRAWQFSHARRDGDRVMGPGKATATRQSYKPAYASTSARQLEKKRRILIATKDWTGLSSSRSHSRSRSHTAVEAVPPSSTIQVKSKRLSPPLPCPPAVRVTAKVEHAEQDTSSLSVIDLDVPSSPPLQDFSSSIATHDITSEYMELSMSTNLEAGLEQPMSSSRTDEATIVSSNASMRASRADSDLVMSATSSHSSNNFAPNEVQGSNLSSTQATTSNIVSPPASEIESPGLQWLPEPYRSMKHISQLSHAPIVFNFLMPCMLGDCRPPFVYDDTILRSNDYLGMGCSGPDMEE